MSRSNCPLVLCRFAMMGGMNPIETLGLALGAGFSSGLNLYATVATLGLLERFGVIHLPPSLHALAHPCGSCDCRRSVFCGIFRGQNSVRRYRLGHASTLSFVRPLPRCLRIAQQAPHQREWRWAAALLAGGVALTSHGTKASARAAVNTTPEPFSNWALSFGEDVLAVWLTWMATVHPLATTVIVVALLRFPCSYSFISSGLRAARCSACSLFEIVRRAISNTSPANPETFCTKTGCSVASESNGLHPEKQPALTARLASAAC